MRVFALPLVVLAALATGTIAVGDSMCNGPDARSTPPTGSIVVDGSGAYKGSFRTVSEAVAQLNPNATEEQRVFIQPGIYNEQVYIAPMAGPLVLQGYTCDSMSYAENTVTITQAKAQKDIPAEVTGARRNDMTSTIRFHSDKVKVYNLNIANTAGNVGQALAVNVNGTDYGFYACNFTGYQDTVLANEGRELYSKSYIAGAVDFVFGLYAKAWFESCDIDVIGKGYVTASGRESEANPFYYVFNNANVFGSSGAGSAYLGRPWRPYARVVFQNSNLSDVINAEGWAKWDATSSTDNIFFKEFNNRGPGAATDKRVAFSGQLNESVPITEILGDDYESAWFVDASYL